MNVYQKLNAARAKFHTLKLTKTGHNKFAGYNYFELGDFLIPALQVFSEIGLLAVVSFEADMARMTILDTDSDAQDPSRIVITSPMGSAALKGCHEVQNIGAVETYQRRYLWVAALEIVEHDALDATTGKETRAEVAKPNHPGVLQMVTASEAADLSQETMTYLNELAEEIKAGFPKTGPKVAYERIELEKLDIGEQLYLTMQLPVPMRNAIKAASTAARRVGMPG